jgi:hypothetical protein
MARDGVRSVRRQSVRDFSNGRGVFVQLHDQSLVRSYSLALAPVPELAAPIRLISPPADPNNNDEGDEPHINQKLLFGVHPYVPASITGLERLIGLGSPKQEWKPLPRSSRLSSETTKLGNRC